MDDHSRDAAQERERKGTLAHCSVFNSVQTVPGGLESCFASYKFAQSVSNFREGLTPSSTSERGLVDAALPKPESRAGVVQCCDPRSWYKLLKSYV
eukprot:1077539-Rhodomonas_salina.1